MRYKCPYSKLLWSAFPRIRTEYGQYLSMFSPNVGKCGPEKLRIRTHLTQCKLRTKIIQLANIILVSGRKRWSHQTTCLESCSNSLWLTIHETSSLLWMWWKFWSSTCFLQKKWLRIITTQPSEKYNIVTPNWSMWRR